MQFIDFDLSYYKMYNSVTGEVIIDEECNEDSKSLIAYWINDVFDEPFIKDDTLKESWETFSAKYEEENEGYSPDYEALEEFLKAYDNPNWKVICITSHGMACGPVSSTAWHVVDKDTVVEEFANDIQE